MSAAQTLPVFIRRPLWGAAAGVGIFLGIFALWAVFAPLATTIALQGTIKSSRPSFSLQHPYGGMVSGVLVQLHDEVGQGQALLRFDRVLEQKTLSTQIAIRDRLTAENADILALLDQSGARDLPQLSPLLARKHQVELQALSARQTNESLTQQVQVLFTKVEHAEAQLALMTDRAERYATLTHQGLRRRSDHEQLQEQILLVKAEIEEDRATIISLEGESLRTRQQQELARVAFEHELTSLYRQNMEKLDQLSVSILDLTDRVAKSVLRAPVQGVVASLPINAEHMMATPGATLVTLARPIDQARISFMVPVNHIDQLRPGMTGRLVIPSLPQRQMPKIDVVIEAISPRAQVDDAGNPVSFPGLAVVKLGALETIFADGVPGSLSEDMPITIIVAVRETTFADYLLTPLLSAFDRALQD
jgi:multidrug efflux pump subunit AcrA (membrane-fusion protein)